MMSSLRLRIPVKKGLLLTFSPIERERWDTGPRFSSTEDCPLREAKMLVAQWWLTSIILITGLTTNAPIYAGAFTLEGYFRILAMAARKRDMWRKIFLGQDLGFEASPWLFDDRVTPPYVPIIKSFPKYPAKGHYRNERLQSSPHELEFPDIYSHLQLSPRLPPSPSAYLPNVLTPYGKYHLGKYSQLNQNLEYVGYPSGQRRNSHSFPQHQNIERDPGGIKDNSLYNYKTSVFTHPQQSLSYQDGR